jgi:hypothetical protein
MALLSDGLRAGRLGFNCLQGQEVLLCSAVIRPMLGPIQFFTQWVSWLFLRGKGGTRWRSCTSHSWDYGKFCILKCRTVQSHKGQLTFLNNI